jgi:aspartate carbamoyltransferase catalytic subunit
MKSLLGLKNLSKTAILEILQKALALKKILQSGQPAFPNTLSGQTVLNLFFEPSTRTRVSFEIAAQNLGGNVINIQTEHSSLQKGESLYDMVQNLDAMGTSIFIVRHQHAGVPEFIDGHVKGSVINAGDGFNEHPTQGLLDVFSMLEHVPTLDGKIILILGDIAHSRVARSNLWALQKLGANVVYCGPKTLVPDQFAELGVTCCDRLDPVLPEADFVNVLRVQYERQGYSPIPSVREYRNLYGLTADRCQTLKPSAVILHPGPINRGIEMDSEVVDGPRTIILDQVTNGVAIRMAVLHLLQTGELS